jgi:hypothetical protein
MQAAALGLVTNLLSHSLGGIQAVLVAVEIQYIMEPVGMVLLTKAVAVVVALLWMVAMVVQAL